jgi:hypothetical protein
MAASSKTGLGASEEGDADAATLAELGGGALAADEAAVACVLGGFVSGVPRPWQLVAKASPASEARAATREEGARVRRGTPRV